MPEFNRSEEDMSNIVALEHVNTRVPDQQIAVMFYVMGLGLTRDPFLMTGVGNMWINVGKSQFHLPTGPAQVLHGVTGLVIPDRGALLARLSSVCDQLEGTQFTFEERGGYVAVVCPWGNRIHCYEPGPDFGPMRLGMPHVTVDVPVGTAAAIVRFYDEILRAPARVKETGGMLTAHVAAGVGQELRFAETGKAAPEFDGHHIAIYLSDFSGPHGRLAERGLITQESNQHQYRFVDIVDLASGKPILQLEHEVRSMRHPLYGRDHLNRNPAITNNNYSPGHEQLPWTVDLPG